MEMNLEKDGKDRKDARLFASPATAVGSGPKLPWVLAGLVVALLGASVLLFAGHRQPAAGKGLIAADPYAPSLVISGLAMSESTSLSGGKSTFLDGVVANTGARTVAGATVQVLFANAEDLPPQIETLPLSVIRTREPYVDTQPLAAAPLAPGHRRDFRLIFEDIGANWNRQLPQVRIVQVSPSK